MRAYVADTVRAEICALKLDEAFAAKDEISSNLKTHLGEVVIIWLSYYASTHH